jgi:hypothetical protein
MATKADQRDWSKFTWFKFKGAKGIKLYDGKGNTATVKPGDLYGVQEYNSKNDFVVVVKDPATVFVTPIPKSDKLMDASSEYKGKNPLTVSVDDLSVGSAYVWYKYLGKKKRLVYKTKEITLSPGVVFGVYSPSKDKHKLALKDRSDYVIVVDTKTLNPLLVFSKKQPVLNKQQDQKPKQPKTSSVTVKQGKTLGELKPEAPKPSPQADVPAVATKAKQTRKHPIKAQPQAKQPEVVTPPSKPSVVAPLSKEDRYDLIKQTVDKLRDSGKLRPSKLTINLGDDEDYELDTDIGHDLDDYSGLVDHDDWT